MLSDHSGLPASFDDDRSREPDNDDDSVCYSCGCDPSNPWYCEDCTNEKCPCGAQNAEDDDDA